MVYLTSTLTHLGTATVKLVVTAHDGQGLSAVRPAEVTVNILSSAQAPAVFQRSRYAFTIPEDAPPGTSVGTVEASNPASESSRQFTWFACIRLDASYKQCIQSAECSGLKPTIHCEALQDGTLTSLG